MINRPPVPRTAAGSFFFYLSYAPSAPSAANPRIRGDYWVRRFFHDLVSVVSEQTGLEIPQLGFCDLLLPAGTDRQAHVQEALAAAEVFVPLYSAAYLDRAESLSERESFRRKLTTAGQSGDGHILPVLWTPLPAPEHGGDRDHALRLALDIEEYGTHGMSALCRMDLYTPQYRTVLTRLARRIARTAPLRPGAAQPLVEVSRPAPSEVPFLAAVIAPTTANLPKQRHATNGYGPGVEHWHPFPAAGPVVEDLADAVERLRMHLEVREFVPDTTAFAERPGLLLVDPWILDTDSGGELLRAAAASIQPWVGVAIVLDQSEPADSERVQALLDLVHRTLPALGVFTTARDWRRGVPDLVERLRRRYLSQGPSYPPDGPPVNRPRLGAAGPAPPEGGSS